MDFGVWLEPILGPKWPSEATSKAYVTKYANGEGSESIYNAPPPLKFSVLGHSVRGKQGEPHRPMSPLTGSADDGKRSEVLEEVRTKWPLCCDCFCSRSLNI